MQPAQVHARGQVLAIQTDFGRAGAQGILGPVLRYLVLQVADNQPSPARSQQGTVLRSSATEGIGRALQVVIHELAALVAVMVPVSATTIVRHFGLGWVVESLYCL
ncbi:hypothetical protein GCM10023172_10990 [Hymenobacter ginsengisoli]|uniref:RDD domain-containing protein n=1 Tax=Hymenobacter ginsengisoli TaxID=1051626 RepID=A0ABP8Q4P2_9BACT|nr:MULTISPECIES: hypothetical protein [unclassified Hymenobacter]MBO2031685.1 hypothetical protein [Hymenobacter sp. BT559]